MPDPRLAVETALAAIARDEARVHAWAYLDADYARWSAERASAGTPGPLTGLTAGVKDIFDTCELPTEYGSAIYKGNRPAADAAAVAMLRAAGAVVMGKTVTAELAWFTPGATTNPHRPTHTPGGSSSGSSAAVAARMVDVALGTQTAGSVIRPASFCGVYGIKPTFGAIPTAGVKQAAPSLDTIGIFGRQLDVLESTVAALTGRTQSPTTARVSFAFVPTDVWDDAGDDSRRVVEDAARVVDATHRQLPNEMVGLTERQPIVQAYEGVRALAWERAFRRDQLSMQLRAILDWGAAIAADEYDDVLRATRRAGQDDVMDRLFGADTVLLTLAVAGEAPEGLSSTGDPRFCRLWTLLGLPTLSVPGAVGSTGLPIGVQLVARRHQEHALFAAARALHRCREDDLTCAS